jgi:hypothetical protein
MRKAALYRRFGACQLTSAGYDNARSEAGVIRFNSRLKCDQPL